jgi:hypothetical protein
MIEADGWARVLGAMPDLAAFLPGLAIIALAVVLVWFTVGTQINVRRGHRTLAWLQEGLPMVGPRATLRWLGSSVAALGIVEPVPPFREADVLVVLEPRDLGAIWALARQRGRRDFLIVRLNLVRAPRFSADLVDPAGWSPGGRRQPDEALTRTSERQGPEGRPYRAHDDGAAPIEELGRAWDGLASASGGMWRLTVQPVVPHLEIHVLPPPDLARCGSARLFTAVRGLAELVSG